MSRAKKANKKRRSRKQASNVNDNSQQMQEAMSWMVNKQSFNDIEFHGNTSWRPADLVVLTVLGVWSREETLTGAFAEAQSPTLGLFGRVALTTYQGLAGALETWTATFMPLLVLHLHTLIEQMNGRHLRVGRWAPIAIDGSRATTPRTKSNEKAFCAKNYGKGQTAKYRTKKTKGMRRRKNKKAKAATTSPSDLDYPDVAHRLRRSLVLEIGAIRFE